jgi:hypothetical protein
MENNKKKANRYLFWGILIILIVIFIDFFILKPQMLKESDDMNLRLTIKNQYAEDKSKNDIDEERKDVNEINYGKKELKDRNDKTSDNHIDISQIASFKKSDKDVDLSPRIVSRYNDSESYSYQNDRESQEYRELQRIQDDIEDKENQNSSKNIKEPFFDRKAITYNKKPNFTYHGFYIIGDDRVAILKKSTGVLLTKIGDKVNNTNYKLMDLNNEKVVLRDISNKPKDYVIFLSDETKNMIAN